MGEGLEKSLFGPAEAPYCEKVVMKPIYGMEEDNQISGSDKERNLTVLTPVKITNPTEDDMAIIICVGIIIDYGNYTSPENVPEQQEK